MEARVTGVGRVVWAEEQTCSLGVTVTHPVHGGSSPSTRAGLRPSDQIRDLIGDSGRGVGPTPAARTGAGPRAHDGGMCDTFVALADATANGSVILAKNSDREPNEAHEVVFVAGGAHDPGAELRCTYITIPQVEHTNAVLLGKPYWIWGAEMGANSHGVVIGNEAVFTKVPYEKEPGLIGMDLLRLGLERADTAEAAVTVITDLLSRYGQGGNCGHTHDLRYHNSFLVTDPGEAWILETAGREWAARRIEGSGSISNAITIGGRFNRSSPGLVDRAVAEKWSAGPDELRFRGRLQRPDLPGSATPGLGSAARTTPFGGPGARRCAGALGVAGRSRCRADGQASSGPSDHPLGRLIGATVCVDAGFGPVRRLADRRMMGLGTPGGGLQATTR